MKFAVKCCNGGCSRGNSWDSRVAKSLTNEEGIFQRHADIHLVERDADNKEVNEVPVSNKKARTEDPFETVTVTVGSGAYNTVGPPHVGAHFRIMDAEASKTGKHYKAANGSVIKNYGQRVIRGTSEDGTSLSLPIQVADVHKVLGSVREMVKAGNWVVFDDDANGQSSGYLEHKKTGKRTAIHENNGSFPFTIQVPRGKEEAMKVSRSEESTKDNESKGFPRPGVLIADLFH